MSCNKNFYLSGNPNGKIWGSRNINYNSLLKLHQLPSPHSFDCDQLVLPINNTTVEKMLLGKSYYNALKCLQNISKTVRIVAIDDFSFVVTKDYDPYRVNLLLKTNRYNPFTNKSSSQRALNYVNNHCRQVIIDGIWFG